MEVLKEIQQIEMRCLKRTVKTKRSSVHCLDSVNVSFVHVKKGVFSYFFSYYNILAQKVVLIFICFKNMIDSIREGASTNHVTWFAKRRVFYINVVFFKIKGGRRPY